VPFAVYTTFAGAGFSYFNYLTRFTSDSNSIAVPSGFGGGFTSSASGLNSIVSGLNTVRQTVDNFSSYSNSNGSSTSGRTAYEAYTYTAFIPNSAIEIRMSDFTGPFNFTDTNLYVFNINKETSVQETGSIGLRATTETTIASTILDIETSWTDITTEAVNLPRTWTTKSATTTYGTGVGFEGGEIFCDFLSGVGLIIQPHYGYMWTQDGSMLQYLEIFYSTGVFSPFYSNIIKDNQENAITIQAETANLDINVSYALTNTPSSVTVILGSTQTVTYDRITNSGTTNITFANRYIFNGTQFVLDTNSPTSYDYIKETKQSSTFTQVIASQAVRNVYKNITGYSDGFFTTTKAIRISTTATMINIDQSLSYFSSFTYSGIIATTAMSSYILFDQGEFGSGAEVFGAYSASTSNIPIPQRHYKSYYSLQLGNTAINYYTQNSPAFNFVVGGTSASVGGYRASLSPSSALTKLYFTTYIFERDGVLGSPTLAIPIDYTSQSNSSYTYQLVDVPKEFCLGNSQASVYWTKSIDGNTTYTTESFTLSYAGSDSLLKSAYYGGGDAESSPWSPFPAYVFHTKGLVNTSSGANWSVDGNYYWNGTSRVTSGSNSNAIAPLGDGMPTTYIGSEWVGGIAFPVVTALKEHINSYNYSFNY